MFSPIVVCVFNPLRQAHVSASLAEACANGTNKVVGGVRWNTLPPTVGPQDARQFTSAQLQQAFRLLTKIRYWSRSKVGPPVRRSVNSDCWQRAQRSRSKA